MKHARARLILVLGILLTACGKLKPDSKQAREAKLAPAPAADSLTAGDPTPPAEPDPASRPVKAPDTPVKDQERRYASLKELAADRFIGCKPPVLCNGLAYFDCGEKGGGPGLYYDTTTVTLVSRCGSFCVDPDEDQKRMCDTSCPPRAWQGCP